MKTWKHSHAFIRILIECVFLFFSSVCVLDIDNGCVDTIITVDHGFFSVSMAIQPLPQTAFFISKSERLRFVRVLFNLENDGYAFQCVVCR